MEDPDALEKRLQALLAYQNTVVDELKSKSAQLLKFVASYPEDTANATKRLKLYERPYQRVRDAVCQAKFYALRQFQRMDDGDYLAPNLHGAARTHFLSLLRNIQYEYYAAHFSAAQEALLRLSVQLAASYREAAQMRQACADADRRVKALEEQLLWPCGAPERNPAEQQTEAASGGENYSRAYGIESRAYLKDGAGVHTPDRCSESPIEQPDAAFQTPDAGFDSKSTYTDETAPGAAYAVPNGKQLAESVQGQEAAGGAARRCAKQDLSITLPGSCVQAQASVFYGQSADSEDNATAWLIASSLAAYGRESASLANEPAQSLEAGLDAGKSGNRLNNLLSAYCCENTGAEGKYLQNVERQASIHTFGNPQQPDSTAAQEKLTYFYTVSSCSRTQEQSAMLAEGPSSSLLLQLVGEHIAQCSYKSETLIKEALQISIDLGKAPL